MQTTTAAKEGVKAFNEGRKRIPYCNQKFLVAACESETDTAKLLDAYTNGWDVANLAAAALKIGVASAPSVAALNKILTA